MEKFSERELQSAKKAYEKISEIMHAAYDTADREWIVKHTCELADIEAMQTFPAYEKAAEYINNLMLSSGLDSEILKFPADGVTAYQDKRMPLAWDASVGRLTVKGGAGMFDDPVIADFEKLPIHLVKGSVSTPEGGIVAKVVTEAQMLAGEDCTGAMVLLEPETRATAGPIRMALDLGAIGFISEYLVNPMDKPDDVYWCNAATDAGGWNVTCDDRDFIGFSISPRNGRKLRHAVTFGGASVLVESDGRRYVGELPAVTALIPGKQKRELWILAHTYEPFTVDDSIGVVGSIAAIKKIKELIEEGKLPPLEFSIRLVYAMEVHGFSAVADHFGGNLRDKVLGGLNADMFFGGKFNQIMIFYAPLAVPFYGNFLMKMAAEVYNKEFSYPEARDMYLSYHDDMLLGDSTVGVPTIWALGEHVDEKGNVDFHHNSSWDKNYIDEENCARALGFYTAWIGCVASMNEELIPDFATASAILAQKYINEEAERETVVGKAEDKMKYISDRMRAAVLNFCLASDVKKVSELADALYVPAFKKETENNLAWLDYAEKLIPARVGEGFPFDKVRIPKKDRRYLPDGVIYGPISFILSAMDGKKTLAQAICEAAWERRVNMTDADVKKYVNAVTYLADWGYLRLENPLSITKDMFVESLKKIGVEKGDVLLVHSGLSYMGHIKGGAETVLDALIEAVGEEGTILLPAFTRPYIGFEGYVNRAREYRPFAPEFFDNINTGAVPKALLHREGTKRSAHVTHSWCGVGKMADYCLSAQELLDAPTTKNSPPEKAWELGGKVLFIGCDIHSNTFLHYLEDKACAPYLGSATIKMKDADGNLRTETIRNHLPGHRSFYGYTPREGEFYKTAFAKGLDVKVEELGMGRLQLMNLKELHDIGMEMFREDPLATLCENPDCKFCQKYRKA